VVKQYTIGGQGSTPKKHLEHTFSTGRRDDVGRVEPGPAIRLNRLNMVGWGSALKRELMILCAGTRKDTLEETLNMFFFVTLEMIARSHVFSQVVLQKGESIPHTCPTLAGRGALVFLVEKLHQGVSWVRSSNSLEVCAMLPHVSWQTVEKTCSENMVSKVSMPTKSSDYNRDNVGAKL
jgi:hypothetical protein